MKLGEKITITSELKRVSKYVQDGESPFKHEYKFWEECKLRHPIEGIVVGIRNLSNGKNEWIPEYGNAYWPKEHFKAAVVAYQLSRKPKLIKL